MSEGEKSECRGEGEGVDVLRPQTRCRRAGDVYNACDSSFKGARLDSGAFRADQRHGASLWTVEEGRKGRRR